jgi:DNA-directed RNA polymerase subunit RPC12/RpoP
MAAHKYQDLFQGLEEIEEPKNLDNVEEENLEEWDMVSCRTCHHKFSLFSARTDGRGGIACPRCGSMNVGG